MAYNGKSYTLTFEKDDRYSIDRKSFLSFCDPNVHARRSKSSESIVSLDASQ
jgi:hypothetical protein